MANKKDHPRVRDKAVAFHVTETEYKTIQMMADVSGLEKQEYLIARATEAELHIMPNIRVRHFLMEYLIEIRDELKRISNLSVDADVLQRLTLLVNIISQM